jgi:hypothetical protein
MVAPAILYPNKPHPVDNSMSGGCFGRRAIIAVGLVHVSANSSILTPPLNKTTQINVYETFQCFTA